MRPAGVEPATTGFVVRYSIQLSYGRFQLELRIIVTGSKNASRDTLADRRPPAYRPRQGFAH